MREITSVNNSYIKELLKLKQKKYRDILKQFIIEGYNIIDEAKDLLVLLLITKKEDEKLYPNCEKILVTNEIIKKFSDTVSPQGIIGICKYKENNLNYANNILALDSLQDPGNIGTLIRSSIGFNFNTILTSLDTTDIYNEKIIRATQGAIFKTNIIKCNLLDELKKLKAKGYYIVGSSLQNGTDVNKIAFKEKNVIILGNEGNGVSKEILDITDINAYIKINERLESLNVGVAGGILMYRVDSYETN